MKKILLATLLTSTSLSVMAADSVDISVIGTISAAACTPIASGGGVVDYGFIRPNTLAENGPTVLDVKTVGFNVVCEAPTNIALKAFSNRKGTTTNVEGPENIAGSARANSGLIQAGLGQTMPHAQSTITQPVVAGLGTANGKNIGGYMLTLPPALVSLDGAPALKKYYTYNTPSTTAKWSSENANVKSRDGHSLFSDNMAYFSYSAAADSSTPTAFTELTATLFVQGYITEQSQLDLSSPINLDGSSTIELYYF